MRVFILGLAMTIFLLYCYIGNGVKLFQCDGKPPYTGELLHTIGLFPLFSVITVWSNDK